MADDPETLREIARGLESDAADIEGEAERIRSQATTIERELAARLEKARIQEGYRLVRQAYVLGLLQPPEAHPGGGLADWADVVDLVATRAMDRLEPTP